MSERRHSALDKARILEVVDLARSREGRPLRHILMDLGLTPATYYRWQRRAELRLLADRVVVPHHRALLPTPEETAGVCRFGLEHPAVGYKRLAWSMVAQDVAYLRPYQVYSILKEHGLLARRAKPEPESLTRPPPATHPDQVWHIDLMYVYVRPKWYYLVDILDAYSRFLVHWTLNMTMAADTITLTVQQALDQLALRTPGEPRIVHDHGVQFLSREWHTFVEAVGVTDIKTRVAHPESNGLIERVHRTHREEGLVGKELHDYYQALDTMSVWAGYYNNERPHSALHYLCPADYYRRDPQACLAERERKLAEALAERARYWQTYADVKEQPGLSLV